MVSFRKLKQKTNKQDTKKGPVSPASPNFIQHCRNSSLLQGQTQAIQNWKQNLVFVSREHPMVKLPLTFGHNKTRIWAWIKARPKDGFRNHIASIQVCDQCCHS